MIGIIRMLTQKPRVRTFSRYSRDRDEQRLCGIESRGSTAIVVSTARTKISCSDASRVSNRRIVSSITRSREDRLRIGVGAAG